MITTKHLVFLLGLATTITSLVVWDCSLLPGNGGQWYPAMVAASRLGVLKYCMGGILLLVGCLIGKAIREVFFTGLGLRDVERLVAGGLFGLAEQLTGVVVIGACDKDAVINQEPLLALVVLALWSLMHHASSLHTDRLEIRPRGAFSYSHLAIPAFLFTADWLIYRSFPSALKPYPLLLLHQVMYLALDASFQCLRRCYPLMFHQEEQWTDHHSTKAGIRFVYHFLKLVLHTTFFMILIWDLVPAVFIIRPYFDSVERLRRELNTLQLHATLARKLERWVPNAREEDIKQGDTVCCICFEDIVTAEGAKKLYPCNHVFHSKCILIWLSRSLHCPYCRTKIRKPKTKRRNQVKHNAPAAADACSDHRAPNVSAVTPPPLPPPQLSSLQEDPFVEFYSAIAVAQLRLHHRLAVQANDTQPALPQARVLLFPRPPS